MTGRSLFCVLLWACGSNKTLPVGGLPPGHEEAGTDAQSGADASGDAADARADAVVQGTDSAAVVMADGGGVCCPPSHSPACCMSFGGWASSASSCASVCDGFSLPTTLSKDSHDCDMWTGAAGPICGASTLGQDASLAAPDGSLSEAAADVAASDASCSDIFFSSIDKTCSKDTDCTTANHNDCCGTVVVGLRIGTEATFTSAESAFQACVPGCNLRGCFHATWAESGPPIADGGTLTVYCDMGACTTRFQ